MGNKAVNDAHTAKQIFIVSEAVDGRIVQTRLPKAEAHRLHQKLLNAGADVSIKEGNAINRRMYEFMEKIAKQHEAPKGIK